ncbi:MAG: hypothetical protein KAR42_03945 [candidate division Zixibacteria bacterium]|nr:hypothetical protein [candidate division Zixibacteria bacterium]
MRTIGVAVLVIFLLFVSDSLEAANFSSNKGLSVSSSLEYQLISQEYYNAIIDTSSIDGIESWVLAKDNIEDLLARVGLQYRYQTAQNKHYFRSDLEVSKDRWIGRGESAITLGGYDSYIKLLGKVELKLIIDEEETGNSGYLHIFSYLKGRQKVSDKISLGGRISVEHVGFNEPKGSEEPDASLGSIRLYRDYDYTLLGGQINGNIALTEFGKSIDWQASITKRYVPDSVLAEYNQFYSMLSYSNFTMQGYVMAEISAEYKDYAQPGNQNDFGALDVGSRIGYSFSDRYAASLFSSFTLYKYLAPDIVNHDNWRGRIEIKGIRHLSDWEFGPKIQFEFSSDSPPEDLESDGVVYSEDYNQWGIGTHVSNFGSSLGIIDAEIIYGNRSYTGQDVLITSYNLINVSIMASLNVHRHLALNLFFDGDFEDHDSKEQNSNLYIFSISVSTHF